MIIRTFVAAGEEVLLSVPTFSMYEARTRVCGGIPVLVPMSEDHEHDLMGMLRVVTERTKVIFLCTPNNPTGNRIAEVNLRRLLRLGLPTVIDEAYYELGEGDSLSYLIQEFPNAIVLRTFSKAFGLAGLRVGYALASRQRDQAPDPGEGAVERAGRVHRGGQRGPRRHGRLRARVAELKTARDELGLGLSRMPGVVAIPSEGNFILVDISHTRMSADRMVQALLAEGVLIRSLGSHHAEKSYVRVTVGTREQNARCLAAFERVLGRRPQRDVGDAGVRRW